MRELARSGFMSNRGRQVVASFLVRDMGQDWRQGAEHFETNLLDHDVTSNWGQFSFFSLLSPAILFSRIIFFIHLA